MSTAGSGVSAALTGAGKFQVRLGATGGHFLADEPEAVGGLASGPTPYELLSAGLAACTMMTLNLYAARKGWDVRDVKVEVAHSRVEGKDRFTRQICFGPEIDADRQAKLTEIADRCPVHRTLERGAEVVTLIPEEIDDTLGAEPAEQHERDMEQCAGAGE